MKRPAILSGCDHDRTLAAANHQYYADRQGLLYVHDTAPTQHGGYNYKLDKLEKFLGHGVAEHVFWLDDDAFFMQPDTPLDPFINEHPKKDLIFCESPVNRHRGRDIQTYISAGNFFIRNTERSRQFIAETRTTPLAQVREWWDETKHGFFSNGDQDAMVYLLHEDERFADPDFCARLPYTAFNTRPFHFTERPDEHFLVHFTGRNKRGQVKQFAKKFGLNEALIPDDALAAMHGLREPQAASLLDRAAQLAVRASNIIVRPGK